MDRTVAGIRVPPNSKLERRILGRGVAIVRDCAGGSRVVDRKPWKKEGVLAVLEARPHLTIEEIEACMSLKMPRWMLRTLLAWLVSKGVVGCAEAESPSRPGKLRPVYFLASRVPGMRRIS